MKRIFLLTLFLLLLPFTAGAATYNYYFSNAGSGSTCSEGSPCATLAAAEAKVDAATSSDTVNLYFNRGDTWTISTGQSTVFAVWNSDPIVNIDAYGSGDRPIFDGGISDFATVDESGTNGYYFYKVVFLFQKNNCSMKNVEIKRIYGVAIRLGSSDVTTNKADYFILSDSYIHHTGYSAVGIGSKTGASNCTIENNTVHTGMELYRNGKVSFWSGGINLYAESYYPSSDNLIRYNVIYDIYGEGIQGGGGIIEKNVIGDTGSLAIHPVPTLHDAEDTIVRYNFIIQSSSATYKNMVGSSHGGITYKDENSAGGDNSNATVEFYGNIIINRKPGIKVYNGDGLGEIRIFNNTIIDSVQGNLVVDDVEEFAAAYIYNNSSILYDRIGETHAVDYSNLLPHGNWTIDNNAYWTTGGSPTIASDWRTNYVITDPKLLGEPSIDWNGMSGATYFSDIEFDSHLYLSSDSALINSGKTLAGYEDSFLTYGTNFGSLPYNEVFTLADQAVYGAWDIGAVIYTGFPENLPPVISDSSVTPASVANEGTLTYSVTASDPESQTLTYSWRINGVQFSTSASSTYALPATYDDSTVQIYCRVCDPGSLCVNTSVYYIDVGTVGETTESFGENTADTYTSTLTDTYIQYGYPDTNYSTSDTLWAKDTTLAANDRKTLIAVDTSSLTGETVTDAYLKIRLKVAWTGSGTNTITMYECDDIFTAVGATWNCAVDDLGNGCTTAWTGTHGQGTELASITVENTDDVGTLFTFEGSALDTYVIANIGSTLYFLLVASPQQIGDCRFSSSEDTNTYRPSLYVTYSDVPPSGNDFTNETSCIGWWELADNTDSKGSDDLTSSNGDPTYGGGGLILDGDDAIYLANLTGNITANMTVWAKYKFSAELTDIHMLTSEWDSTGEQKCWYLMMRESLAGGDTEDHIKFGIGSNGGADSNHTEDTSFDLVHGTTYNSFGTFDNTNKDMHIYTFNEGGTTLENTDPNATHNVAINNENVSFYIGRQEDSVGASHYCPDTTTIYEVGLFTRELSEDECQAVASEQFPVASIQDDRSQTPDTSGIIGIADIFVVSREFDKPVTWTDGAAPYAFITIETGATDLQLYHSYPATGVAGTIHYFTSYATDPDGAGTDYENCVIASGMTSADAAITGSMTLNGGTFQYGNPAIDADLITPSSPHRLQDNAAIVIDTTPIDFSIGTFFHSNSSGTQIDIETTYTEGDLCCVCVESDGDEIFIVNGPITNVKIGTDSSYPDKEEFEYYDGAETTKLIFCRIIQARDRDLDLQAEGTAEDVGLIHGSTELIDEAFNECTYTLPQADPTGGNIIIAAPGTIADPWLIGTGGHYATVTALEAAIYLIDNDVLRITSAVTESITYTNDAITLIYLAAVTGTLDVNGDNGFIYDSSRYVSGARTEGGAGNTWYLRYIYGGIGSGIIGTSSRVDDTP